MDDLPPPKGSSKERPPDERADPADRVRAVAGRLRSAVGDLLGVGDGSEPDGEDRTHAPSEPDPGPDDEAEEGSDGHVVRRARTVHHPGDPFVESAAVFDGSASGETRTIRATTNATDVVVGTDPTALTDGPASPFGPDGRNVWIVSPWVRGEQVLDRAPDNLDEVRFPDTDRGRDRKEAVDDLLDGAGVETALVTAGDSVGPVDVALTGDSGYLATDLGFAVTVTAGDEVLAFGDTGGVRGADVDADVELTDREPVFETPDPAAVGTATRTDAESEGEGAEHEAGSDPDEQSTGGRGV